MKSVHGIDYQVELREILNLKIYCLKSLDQTIDQLCEVLGERLMDDALKEDYCPYFGVPWEAGMALAQHLKNNAHKFPKTLEAIEIGSGLALPSFVLAQQGLSVLATDFHQDVLTFLSENQKVNDLYFPFEFINFRANSLDHHKKYDLVIGSDILYESSHPDSVVRKLISLCKPGGKIILSDPGRAYIQQFISIMHLHGMNEEAYIHKVLNKEVWIFEFKLPI